MGENAKELQKNELFNVHVFELTSEFETIEARTSWRKNYKKTK